MTTLTLGLLWSLSAPVPVKGESFTIMVATADGTVRLLNEKGEESLAIKLTQANASHVRLSPDGQSVAYAVRTDAKGLRTRLYVESLVKREVKTLTECQHLANLAWSPDGKTLLACGLDINKGNQPQFLRHQCWLSWLVDVAAGKDEPIEIDGEYRLIGFGADGQYLSVRTFDPKPVGNGVAAPQLATHAIDAKTMKKTEVIPASAEVMPIARLADGRRWLVKKTDHADRKQKVGIYDVAADKFALLDGQSKTAFTHAIPAGPGFLCSGGSQLWHLASPDAPPRKISEVRKAISSLDLRAP
jgi:hypothetical protein